MTNMRDISDDKTSTTTRVEADLWNFCYKFDLEVLFMPGSSSRKEAKWQARQKELAGAGHAGKGEGVIVDNNPRGEGIF